MYKLVMIAAALCVVSCQKSQKHVPTCDGSNPTFVSQVEAIVEDNCYACHSAGSGNTVYTSYEDMEYSFTDGSFESEVLSKQTMPEGKSLTNAQLDLLRCWVDNGFPKE